VLPAALPEVMAVSAMGPDDYFYPGPGSMTWNARDKLADFSNWSVLPKSPSYVSSPGAGIDVAAPGVKILSNWTNSSYATFSGTSMAAPHVAGLVALYIAANGRAHSLQDVMKIRQAIVDGSQPQWAWHPATNYWPDSTIGDNTTDDPDRSPEPLAFPSEAWVPLRIASAQMISGAFQLGLTTSPGYLYAVHYKESLQSTDDWQLLTITNATGYSATVTDSPAADERFYRLARTGPVLSIITNFAWSPGGDVPWFTQTNVSYAGGSAWQSGQVGQGQHSFLQTIVVGPGVLSFWGYMDSWGVPSFYLDGVESFSGDFWDTPAPGYWYPASYPIAAGSHTVRWQLDYGGTAWVDQVIFSSPNPWSP